MTALFISRIKVRDPDKLQAYARATGPTIAAHGGKLLHRGVLAKALLGEADHQMTSIIEFPDIAAIDAWFASPAYQAHADLREAAGDMQFVAYESPVA